MVSPNFLRDTDSFAQLRFFCAVTLGGAVLFLIFGCVYSLQYHHINNRLCGANFCSQTYFDSISFDGKNFRFTVNAVNRSVTKQDQFYFHHFNLTFVESKNMFDCTYERINWRFGNL